MRGEFSLGFSDFPLIKFGPREAGYLEGEIVFSFTRWDWEIDHVKVSLFDRTSREWVLIRADDGLCARISAWWLADEANCDLADEKVGELTDADERAAQAADAREIA